MSTLSIILAVALVGVLVAWHISAKRAKSTHLKVVLALSGRITELNTQREGMRSQITTLSGTLSLTKDELDRLKTRHAVVSMVESGDSRFLDSLPIIERTNGFAETQVVFPNTIIEQKLQP